MPGHNALVLETADPQEFLSLYMVCCSCDLEVQDDEDEINTRCNCGMGIREFVHCPGRPSVDKAVLDVHFISSSPVELPYACMVEGDRKLVQNVGGAG